MRFRSTGARERAGRPAALSGRSEPRLAPKTGREPGAPEIELMTGIECSIVAPRRLGFYLWMPWYKSVMR